MGITKPLTTEQLAEGRAHFHNDQVAYNAWIARHEAQMAFEAKFDAYEERARHARFSKVPFDEPSPITGWVSPLYNVLEWTIGKNADGSPQRARGKVIFVTGHGLKVSLDDESYDWLKNLNPGEKVKGGRVIYLHETTPRVRRRDLEPIPT